jgi:hypothetical protein
MVVWFFVVGSGSGLAVWLLWSYVLGGAGAQPLLEMRVAQHEWAAATAE